MRAVAGDEEGVVRGEERDEVREGVGGAEVEVGLVVDGGGAGWGGEVSVGYVGVGKGGDEGFE